MHNIDNLSIKTYEIETDTHYKRCTIHLDDPEVKLSNMVFERCTFILNNKENWDIRSCIFKSCDLSLLSFENSYFSKVDFERCKLMNFSLYKCSLNTLAIYDSMGPFMSISDSKIRALKIADSSCKEASFMRLDHKNLIFKDTILDGVNFEETNLRGIDLQTCDFTHIFYSMQLVKGLKIRADQAIPFVQQMGISVETF